MGTFIGEYIGTILWGSDPFPHSLLSTREMKLGAPGEVFFRDL